MVSTLCFWTLIVWGNTKLERISKELHKTKYAEASSFVGGVSHELRTPLHAILNLITSVLESGCIDPSEDENEERKLR
jgi:signal transduction histidine kinase